VGVCLRANEARCRDKADYQQTLHSSVPPLTLRARSRVPLQNPYFGKKIVAELRRNGS
jgi:hypothetical protein